MRTAILVKLCRKIKHYLQITINSWQHAGNFSALISVADHDCDNDKGYHQHSADDNSDDHTDLSAATQRAKTWIRSRYIEDTGLVLATKEQETDLNDKDNKRNYNQGKFHNQGEFPTSQNIVFCDLNGFLGLKFEPPNM